MLKAEPNVTAGILPLPLQEQTFLPRQRLAQRNHKLKQKQINKENNDQERIRPHNDLIPMSYANLLPILINAGEIVPKQV